MPGVYANWTGTDFDEKDLIDEKLLYCTPRCAITLLDDFCVIASHDLVAFRTRSFLNYQ